MFGWFKRKKKDSAPKKPDLVDLAQQPLAVGDRVESLRYDLGVSLLVEMEDGIYYQSEKDGRKIHWTRMIDASTQFQKVKKITPHTGEQ